MMDEEGEEEDDGDEDYDPDKDYIKEEEEILFDDKKEFTCNICGLGSNSTDKCENFGAFFVIFLVINLLIGCQYRQGRSSSAG